MAVQTAGNVKISTVTVSTAASLLLALNNELTSVGWTATGIANGYRMDSPYTPTNLRMAVYIQNLGETGGGYEQIRIRIGSVNGSVVSTAAAANGTILRVATTGTTYRMIISKFQAFISPTGAYVQNYAVAWGVPYIWSDNQPKVITNIAAGTPGVITSANHGFNNGDVVFPADIPTGITGLTTAFTVANKTANTFEAQGTTVAGTYTSGGVVANVASQVAEIMWLSGSASASWMWLFNTFYSANGAAVWTIVNGSQVPAAGYGVVLSGGGPQVSTMVPVGATRNKDYKNWFGKHRAVTPELCFSYDVAVDCLPIGQLWDAFMFSSIVARDATDVIDGRNAVCWSSIAGSGSYTNASLVLFTT